MRISADIDSVIGGFAIHAGPQVAPDAAVATLAALPAPVPGDTALPESRPPWELGDDEQPQVLPSKPPWEDATPDGGEGDAADPVANVPGGPAKNLTAAFAAAAGLTAVAESAANAREAQAARFTGWPLARLARHRRDPLRSLRGTAQAAQAAGQASQSEVDNAITAFADAVGGGLPEPWSTSLREAARSEVGMVPQALAGAVHHAVPDRATVPAWWRLITAWQWLLTVLAAGGIGWAVVIAVAHGGREGSTLLGDVSLIPWLLIMAAAMLLLGFLTASGCRNVAVLAAERERERAEQAMREQVAAVTRDLVLFATGREIAQYERYRKELALAAGPHGTWPSA